MASAHHDPLMRPASTDRGVMRPREPSLFDLLPKPERSTVEQAAIASAKVAPRKRAEILRLLQEHGPQCLWELAQRMRVPDHSISGRLTDMKAKCIIEPTGERRPNPRSGVRCDVYRIAPRHQT